MHADIAGATRIVRLASEFHWTWYTDDIPRFCDAAGWEIDQKYESRFSIRTNLDIEYPEARVSIRRRTVQALTFRVTDIDSEAVAFDLSLQHAAANFKALSTAVSDILGEQPRRVGGPEAMDRWDLPAVVVILSEVTRSISIRLVSPEYQAWLDEPEADED